MEIWEPESFFFPLTDWSLQTRKYQPSPILEVKGDVDMSQNFTLSSAVNHRVKKTTFETD